MRCVPQVEALRSERDALKAKVELLSSILSNQQLDDPNTALEEENQRLLLLISEIRQRMGACLSMHVWLQKVCTMPAHGFE